MRVTVFDDFDMGKIQISGQCFRVKEIEEGVFRFITGNHVVYIKKAEDGPDDEQEGITLEVSCTKTEWEEVWTKYFDLERNYEQIVADETGKHEFTDRAIACGRGLRILKQDPWEMLITFIISQRKSIPAISSAVEALCRRFGDELKTEKETVYTFPTPEQMSAATAEDLKACGLGYRAPYIRNAVDKACQGDLNVYELENLPDDELYERLIELHGVGKKVANCVLLFGYARCNRVPVDVWISRAIDENFGGENLFPMFGENGGIIQQYVFYYEKHGLNPPTKKK